MPILDDASAIRVLSNRGAITVALRKEHSAIESGLQVLGDAVLAAASEEAVTQIINTVIDFCESHFANEEEAFRAWAYVGLESHASAHRGLLDAFRAARNAIAGGEIEAALDVSDLLNGMHGHIAGFDQPAYLEMLRQSIERTGGTPEELTELEQVQQGIMFCRTGSAA